MGGEGCVVGLGLRRGRERIGGGGRVGRLVWEGGWFRV